MDNTDNGFKQSFSDASTKRILHEAVFNINMHSQ